MKGDKIGLVFGSILHEETNQHGYAVDIGQKLCDFIPRRWGEVRAPNKAPMPSASGRWIWQMC